jgi:hypothetical protein
MKSTPSPFWRVGYVASGVSDGICIGDTSVTTDYTVCKSRGGNIYILEVCDIPGVCHVYHLS